MSVVNVCGVYVVTDSAELVGWLDSRRTLMCNVYREDFEEALVVEPVREGEPWALLKTYYYMPYVYKDHVLFYCWNDCHTVGEFKEKTLVLYRCKDRKKNRGFVLFMEDGKGGREFIAAWFNCILTEPTIKCDAVDKDVALSQEVRAVALKLNWRAIQRPDTELLYHDACKLLRK